MGIMKSKIQVKDFVVILRAFSSYIDGCDLPVFVYSQRAKMIYGFLFSIQKTGFQDKNTSDLGLKHGI